MMITFEVSAGGAVIIAPLMRKITNIEQFSNLLDTPPTFMEAECGEDVERNAKILTD